MWRGAGDVSPMISVKVMSIARYVYILVLATASAAPLLAAERIPDARICDDPSPVADVRSIVACSQFDDLGEPRQLIATTGVRARYRFLASPSFQQPVLVRVDIQSNERATLSIRTREPLSNVEKGADGIYGRSESLSATETRRFLTVVERSNFWNLPGEAVGPRVTIKRDGSEVILVCADGVVVAIEALEGNRYHVSTSGCGNLDAFVELASTIMDLTRTKFQGLNRPWMVRFREYLH